MSTIIYSFFKVITDIKFASHHRSRRGSWREDKIITNIKNFLIQFEEHTRLTINVIEKMKWSLQETEGAYDCPREPQIRIIYTKGEDATKKLICQ